MENPGVHRTMLENIRQDTHFRSGFIESPAADEIGYERSVLTGLSRVAAVNIEIASSERFRTFHIRCISKNSVDKTIMNSFQRKGKGRKGTVRQKSFHC